MFHDNGDVKLQCTDCIMSKILIEYVLHVELQWLNVYTTIAVNHINYVSEYELHLTVIYILVDIDILP